MCFSPSVSFGTGIILATTGVAAVYRSRTLSQKTLAVVPLLFALQQCSEGIVWMSFLSAEWVHRRSIATYIFLFFAQIVWPVYMPFCALLCEYNLARKKIIGAIFISGIVLATYTGIMLMLHVPVAIAEAHHIRYKLEFTLAGQWYYGVLYFIPAVLSLMLSSHKSLRWLGYSFLLSYLFTRLLFHLYVISVWCFFGAAISVLILIMIPRIGKTQLPQSAGLIE